MVPDRKRTAQNANMSDHQELRFMTGLHSWFALASAAVVGGGSPYNADANEVERVKGNPAGEEAGINPRMLRAPYELRHAHPRRPSLETGGRRTEWFGTMPCP